MNSPEKEIARKSNSSFYYAFNLMPKEKSEAMNSIYAFCRQTDDIVDNESQSLEYKRKNILLWKNEFTKALDKNSKNYMLVGVANTIDKFNISSEPFFDLIRGMEMDLDKTRYKNFDELKEYCYCAASTVGLMSIEIFGYESESTKKFAEYLGLALQLTNIIRDVYEDTKNDRIYIPEEDFIRFGYSEEKLFSAVYDESFYNLMNFQAERAEKYYKLAETYLDPIDKKNMFAAMTMRHIYYLLLQELKNNKFDVFNSKVKISKSKKLMTALLVLLKYKVLY